MGGVKHRNPAEACTLTREQKAAGRLQRAESGSLPGTSDSQCPLLPSLASQSAAAPFRMLLDLIRARGLTGSAPLQRNLFFIL